MVPQWLRTDPAVAHAAAPRRTRSLRPCLPHPAANSRGMVETLFDRLFPEDAGKEEPGERIRGAAARTERLRSRAARADPRGSEDGRIGLAQNRLPASTIIEDVRPDDVVDALDGMDQGSAASSDSGRRWPQAKSASCTLGRRRRQPLDAGRRRGQGAAPVLQARRKASHLHRSSPGQEPAHRPGVRHRSAAHHHHQLSHARARSRVFWRRKISYGYGGPLLLSPGRAIGLRLVPMVRDLRFAWEELPQKMLDEQQQKMRRACTPP